MKSIYKYELKIADEQVVKLPKFAESLSVQVQKQSNGTGVDLEEREVESRVIKCVGTGHGIKDKDLEDMFFIGTVQLLGGSLVFHYFEVLKDIV